MRIRWMLISIWLLFAVALPPATPAAVMDWNVIKTLKIKDDPIDLAFSTSRNQIYVLTAAGEILVYAADGSLVESIAVGNGFDQMRHIQGSDILFLTSRKDKTVKIIELEYVQEIDLSGSPSKGPENAPVKIAVFTDFQCPYCAKLAEMIDQVVDKYPEKVRVVFKNYPIRSHQYAEKAALAALAAERQGKFWEFHDLLFADYRNLDDEKVREFARELNLDMEKFESDWSDPRLSAQIQTDTRQGSQAGVRGTPTVFINGRRLKDRSLEGFSKMIDEALKETQGS
ncbi:MAG TPA: thioredoxin domain-containing protein [Desulfobacterales bacterium]